MRRRRFGQTPEQKNIVEAEQTSSLMGTLMTIGGACGIYMLGVHSGSIMTIGILASLGGVLYKTGLLGGSTTPK